MPENSAPGTPPAQEIQARLHQVAASLRESPSVDPEARAALAGLLEELGAALGPAPPSPEVANLARTAAKVAESLHHPHEPGRAVEARGRLEQALRAAESRAPFVSGLVQRILETLANMGI
jgi:hypothetical protein